MFGLFELKACHKMKKIEEKMKTSDLKCIST